MAAVVAGWAALLARFPAGSRASFLYSPNPHSVVLDLAVQAAGLVAAPVSEGHPGQVTVEEQTVLLPSWEEAERAGVAAPERIWGGVVVGAAEISSEELVRMAERLEIPQASGERDIMVLGGFAGHWPERLLLSWVTVTGAALLLEPDAPALVQTAAWARVTVFAGTAADLVLLRATVERDEAGFRIFRRKRRLPFGRLRAVVVTEGDLPGEERAFWAERGVPITRVPRFAAERQERGI